MYRGRDCVQTSGGEPKGFPSEAAAARASGRVRQPITSLRFPLWPLQGLLKGSGTITVALPDSLATLAMYAIVLSRCTSSVAIAGGSRSSSSRWRDTSPLSTPSSRDNPQSQPTCLSSRQALAIATLVMTREKAAPSDRSSLARLDVSLRRFRGNASRPQRHCCCTGTLLDASPHVQMVAGFARPRSALPAAAPDCGDSGQTRAIDPSVGTVRATAALLNVGLRARAFGFRTQ